MPNLNQIVDIQITRETRGISQVGFGTPLVLGQHTRFAERARIYTDIEGVAADFLVSDAEYKAALAIFSQELTPERIVIGRRTAKVAQVRTVSIATIANSFNYQVTVNGVTFQFTSDADATGAEIQAGLVAAVNAGSEPVTSSPGAGTTVLLTADVPGTAFTSAVGTNLTIADTTLNNGVVEDLEAVRALNDDWYMLCLTSRLEDDIMNAAAYMEALRKMFIACVEDTAVRDNTAGNVLEKLEAKGYDRTALLWSDDQENYPEAAWMGRVLPLDPGSETWKFKRLQGNIASVLTATQASNILTKKGNTYEEFASAPITREGTVVSGEYIDVMRFVDWLEARMQEDIFQVLINVPKIPYTDGGVSVIESLVRKRLLIGVRVGGLAQDPEFTVSVPKVASIPANTKAQRLLPDVKFVATLAGAIHKIQIRGRVVL